MTHPRGRPVNGSPAYSLLDAYEYIVAYKAAQDGLSPTLREIARDLDLGSKNTAYHCIHELQRRGLVELYGRRGLKVIGGRWLPPPKEVTD